jgi:tetratricopeptide (TPR) repeat protein
LGRFRRLPQRATEVWQGALRKLPMWIDHPDDPDGEPHRPVGAIWVSARTGLINMELPPDGEPATTQLAFDALLGLGLKHAKELDGRPGRIEVDDARLRDALALALSELNTPVVVVDSLPLVTDALLRFEAETHDGVRPPGALEAPGVTPERLRAFADAAAAFHRARPWEHLSDEDLIVIEAAPEGPRGMAHVSVLGKGEETFGLAFFETRREFEQAAGLIDDAPDGPLRAHGVTFGPLDELPFADADAWEQHALPVADPQAYPLAADMRDDGSMSRPGAAALSYFEAVLRALAVVTEDELDEGRWQRRVEAYDGPVTLTCTLPLLLEAEAERAEQADAAPGGEPLSVLEEAQQLAFDASEAPGRLQIKLARRALALSPECVEAWLVLGDAAASADTALAHYQRGLDAGERAIGAANFAAWRGEFWEHLETRSYMHARLSLAEALADLGRDVEACEHYQEMLALNPNDNQGARYGLLLTLLDHRRDEEAGALLDRYADDGQAIWLYGRTLWHLRTQGDSPDTRAALDDARRANPHVVKYLLQPDSMPLEAEPQFAFGSKEEGAYAAEELLEAFEMTDGALAWLRTHASSSRGPTKRRGAAPRSSRPSRR